MLVFACLQLIAVYQFRLHSQLFCKLDPFEHILMTPSHHRVHHGSQSQYFDKNCGALTALRDKFLGTFEPEVEPVKYGLTQRIDSRNPMAVLVFEYLRVFKDLGTAKSWGERWRYLTRSPGWTPNQSPCPGAHEKSTTPGSPTQA